MKSRKPVKKKKKAKFYPGDIVRVNDYGMSTSTMWHKELHEARRIGKVKETSGKFVWVWITTHCHPFFPHDLDLVRSYDCTGRVGS